MNLVQPDVGYRNLIPNHIMSILLKCPVLGCSSNPARFAKGAKCEVCACNAVLNAHVVWQHHQNARKT